MGSGSQGHDDARARLMLVTGPRAGETIEISYNAVIGRSHADIIISDPELSRQHVAIRPVAGGVELDDLGSLNGTWVDERRISSPMIAGAGARIRFGTTVAEVVGESAGAVTAARQTARPGAGDTRAR